MKVYIAGKVTGLPNYKEHFDKAEKELIAKGHLVMNPSVLPQGWDWEDYLPICYAMIDVCDVVYMLNNWQDSKGANLELACAEFKRKEIWYEPLHKPLLDPLYEECKYCGYIGNFAEINIPDEEGFKNTLWIDDKNTRREIDLFGCPKCGIVRFLKR